MKRFFFISGIILFMASASFADNMIKKPNVAGQFYTANPIRLSAEVNSFFNTVPALTHPRHIEILIAPHAGYMYSGQIAAYAFKHVQGKPYQTVVILAPSHHFGFPGISVWAKGGFKTPIGLLSVDEEFAKQLIDKDALFNFDPTVFEREHALEVELPFIQVAIPDAKIVPVIVGQASLEVCRKLAESLNDLIGDRDDVLVVVSSDMSHFHQADQARAMDEEAIRLVKGLEIEAFWKQCAVRKLEMCGFVPVTTALFLAELRGLKPEHLIYGHSGDITGDLKSVVGYTSFIFYQETSEEVVKDDKTTMEQEGEENTLTLVQKKRLITIAKQTVDLYVREKKILPVKEDDARLKKIEGAFVTLHKQGELRGCIGNIIGQQPLYLTVRDMAIAASSKDPRFSPVTSEELADIDIEISVLSKPRRAKSLDEIQMGVHGVIVRRGWNQGVFLPQVATETGWDRETFLSYLCQHKAGLPADAWKDPKTELDIFTAEVFSEQEILE